MLRKAKSLNKAEKYNEVIKLLTDEILKTFNNKSLKVEKADAYNSIGINYRDNKDFEAADDAYQKALKLNPLEPTTYFNLGLLNGDRNDDEKAIYFYNKAIEIDSKDHDSYNNLGSLYFKKKDYITAKEYFQKALTISPKDVVYNCNLGSAFLRLNQAEKAVIFYSKAVEINDKYVDAYGGLGTALYSLGDYEKAISFLDKGVKIEPNQGLLYYSRGLAYQKIEKYADALDDFKKHVALSAKIPDYYTYIAKSRIIELKKQIKNVEYRTISETVSKIKNLLLFEGDCITHYTSLSVSKILILDANSKFRLSEGAYLNDTAEGRELFNFLPPCYPADIKAIDTIAKPFAPKPFIGSFVADTKHDDLTLWRMYGKEEKDEAKGCAITIEREKLLGNISNSLIPVDDNTASEKITEEFSFYRVAYRNQQEDVIFTIPGASAEVVKELNDLMVKLSAKIKSYLPRKKMEDRKNLVELLNEIAYLFKNAEYQYENELRLVVKGIGIEKNIITDSFPARVFINLVSIIPLIKKITLGPKVDRAEEWASAFYYSLDKQDCHPEILISRLPFK